MYSLIIFIVGYLWSSSEVFGAELVNGLEWLYVWFWVIGIIQIAIAAIIALGLMGIGTAAGAQVNGKLGAMIGLGGTAIVSIMAIIKTVVLVVASIMLTGWLVDSIDQTITEIAQLTSNQMLALVIIFSLFLVNIMFSKLANIIEEKQRRKEFAKAVVREALEEALKEQQASGNTIDQKS